MRNSINRLKATMVVWFALVSLGAYAQEPLAVTRIHGGIVFDGIPDEDAWQQVPSLKMTMHQPVFGIEPSESSVIKMAYDQEYFYISGILNYENPSTIRAVSKKRDFANLSTDWLGLIIDTYDDKENAVTFWTNPNGLRLDFAVQNDCTKWESDLNITWNTFWDAKAVITDHGWTAEIRIPFSSLRFQVKDGKTYMGITVSRYCAAKSESGTFPPVSPEFANANWKPSLTTKIVFEGLNPRNPFYLTPYVTAGLSQVNELNGAGTDYQMSSKPKFDAGLDAKFSLSNNLTADVTLNTDFAQVEADDQKINLTRYSLFFPEKRVFFQEKGDVFDFSFLDGNNLFYSRRIGIYDGNPARIYGGMRLTGKVNKWDLGVLDMQTAPVGDHPGENFGVFRTKRSVFNQNSYVGGMLTTRIGMNGAYNVAYGVDGQFRVKGDEYLTLRLAQSIENGSENKMNDLSPSRLVVQWERRKQKGFSYDFVYGYSGTRFNPGIGFELMDNYQVARGILRYGWFPGKNARIRINKLSVTGFNIWDTSTGRQETASGMLTWSFEAKKGYSGNINGTWSQEDLKDTLILGNDQAIVPPGRYSFAYLTAMYSTSASNALAVDFSGEAGNFYDGQKVTFAAAPRLNIGSDLNLSITYQLDFVSFPGRDLQFTNHIAGIKGLLTVSTKTSLAAYIQYNTAISKFVTNIRFRWNPREGNDFYIVYNEGLNSNIRREVPYLPYSNGRTVLLKYTYTFRL